MTELSMDLCILDNRVYWYLVLVGHGLHYWAIVLYCYAIHHVSLVDVLYCLDFGFHAV
jgi:hypothetical protein